MPSGQESCHSNEQLFYNHCALRQHNTNGCNDKNNSVSSRIYNMNNDDDDNNSNSSIIIKTTTTVKLY